MYEKQHLSSNHTRAGFINHRSTTSKRHVSFDGAADSRDRFFDVALWSLMSAVMLAMNHVEFRIHGRPTSTVGFTV